MNEDEREARIRALLPIVRQVARRLHRMVPTADPDDLIGDGSIGLIRAVDAFDPERGVPLEQYARKLILGAMLNGMRRLDPVSERVRRRVRQAENARFALAQELGTVPSLQTLATRDPALARARTDAHRATPLSLDAALPLGERIVLAHYYGERSLRSLGAPLGISPQRVSQLHVAAMRRLRVALIAEGP